MQKDEWLSEFKKINETENPKASWLKALLAVPSSPSLDYRSRDPFTHPTSVAYFFEALSEVDPEKLPLEKTYELARSYKGATADPDRCICDFMNSRATLCLAKWAPLLQKPQNEILRNIATATTYYFDERDDLNALIKTHVDPIIKSPKKFGFYGKDFLKDRISKLSLVQSYSHACYNSYSFALMDRARSAKKEWEKKAMPLSEKLNLSGAKSLILKIIPQGLFKRGPKKPSGMSN